MQLADGDVTTREVLGWQGVHLFHARGSSCSQKVRIFLRLKGIPWESHEVDLKAEANCEPWYLGINPRGLVPCLVHDGVVHIESNDIVEYLERCYPDPPLIPTASRQSVHQMLRMENDLHMDLRALTFRYVIPTSPGAMKSSSALSNLREADGTVGGQSDTQRAKEVSFWDAANDTGITDVQVAESTARFKSAFEQLDETLGQSKFILGDSLTILDIAWYVYATRLSAAGYPLHRLHESVGAWFDKLDQRPEFRDEVEMPVALREAGASLQQAQRDAGRSLSQLGGLWTS